MTVPGIVGALEGEQRPRCGRHLRNHVVEVVGGLEKPQAPASVLPFRIHIDQDGDDLAFCGGVAASILRTAPPAHGDRMRAAGKIEAEFPFESGPELVRTKLVDELLKAGSELELRHRKAAGLLDLRVVAVDGDAGVRTDEAGRDRVLKGLLGEWSGGKRLHVEQTQSHRKPPLKLSARSEEHT